MTKKQQGQVKWFDDKKGYGFISRANGKDLFVHYTGIVGEGRKSLTEGDKVEFFEETSPKDGKPMAVEVERI